MADVAVVVGNYQGEAAARRLSREPAQSRRSRRRRCIVVDGASTDRSAAVAAGFGARVIETRNLGLGHLYNVGAQAASSDYVFLANNDIALEPNCLELLAAALDEDESRFAADATAAQLGRHPDDPRTDDATPRPDVGRVPPRAPPRPARRADEIVPTVAAHGAAMLVRRSMMLELGRLRRDLLHGRRRPRPLLARVDARLAVCPRSRRRRPPPRRRRDRARSRSRAGSPRRTTT